MRYIIILILAISASCTVNFNLFPKIEGSKVKTEKGMSASTKKQKTETPMAFPFLGMPAGMVYDTTSMDTVYIIRD